MKYIILIFFILLSIDVCGQVKKPTTYQKPTYQNLKNTPIIKEPPYIHFQKNIIKNKEPLIIAGTFVIIPTFLSFTVDNYSNQQLIQNRALLMDALIISITLYSLYKF